jgi:hypothetical protein
MKPVRNLFVPLLILLFFACKKESFTNNSSAVLRTSVDTLHFDTVFTTTGSTSQFIKIINDNNKGIHISSVKLAGGASSPFKINVDGIPGPQVSNADVLAEDSIYIYVTVSINPTAANLPFIVRDSIEINYNGNKKFVQLDAYGRNAHFFRNRKITSFEIWNNDLPYVILGGLTIDTNATLSINKGCKIYSHADAPFIVNGTLWVNGEKEDSSRVVFTGDRLDEPYKNFPASYPGIIFTDVSKNNILNYTIIKNAYQGIVVTNPSAGIKLSLNETIIDNAYDAGLLGVNTSITARNLLVSNCGKNILLVAGGNYNFSHCTAATISSNFVQHKEPILVLSNYLNNTAVDLNAVFRNCIFWGEDNGIVDDEVVVLKKGNTAFNVTFDQVLWRIKTNPANSTINGALNKQKPQFDSVNTSQKIYSFRLKEGSPALNKGGNAGVTVDLDGNLRPVGLPDLGAYEKQ